MSLVNWRPFPASHSPLPIPTRNYPPPHPRSRPYSCPAEKQSKFFLYFNTRGTPSYVPSSPLCLCLYKWSILPTYTHTQTHTSLCVLQYIYIVLFFFWPKWRLINEVKRYGNGVKWNWNGMHKSNVGRRLHSPLSCLHSPVWLKLKDGVRSLMIPS